MIHSPKNVFYRIFFDHRAFLAILTLLILSANLSGQSSPVPDAPVPPSASASPVSSPGPVTTVVDFSKTVDHSRSHEAEVRTTKFALSDPDNWSLTIHISPEDSTLVIDGKSQSNSGASMNNPANMNPSISASHDGYKNFSTTLALQKGFNLDVEIILAPRVGWLNLSANVPIQEISVDGEKSGFPTEPVEIPTGYHSIRARSFGYQDFTANLNIEEDVIHSFKLGFVPVDFRLSALDSSKKRFRPGNPGKLGATLFRFQVSAPGTAILVIENPEGIQVRSHEFPDFETWDQEYSWDGRGEDGKELPEGEYTCKITGVPKIPTQSPSTSLAAKVSIDNSMFMKPRGSGFGTSGPAHIMDTYILGEGGISLGSTFSVLGQQGSLATSDAIALDVWLRGSPADRLELTAGLDAGMAYNDNLSTPTVFLYGGVKYQLIKPASDVPGLSWAIGLKGSGYISANPLPAYREINGQTAGASLQNAIQLDIQPFLAILDIGFRINAYASYSSLADLWFVPAPTVALALGVDNDIIHWTLGAKVEFLDLSDIFSGTVRGSSQNTLAAGLGSWGMSAPPRISTQFMITSPWNLAFGLDMFCQLYPGAGFLDHPGISLTVIFME